ncbi:MAG: hypothetical protein GC134_08740 [Proteobacteria bacterium]|nr:hypothetical protein [Pseudomonadota bacterium]
MKDLLHKKLSDYLNSLEDPRKEAILAFHRTHQPLIERAHGSSHNHQAWVGGYKDHLAETFRLAEVMYSQFDTARPLPFTLASALICLYFHDVEKIWQYTTGLPEGFDKGHFYMTTLPETYGIHLTNTELNALEYAHGEVHAHSKKERKMNELAALVHAADNLSARMWHNEGQGLG